MRTECPDCGLHQHLVLQQHRKSECPRCRGVLTRPTRSLGDSLALVSASLVLFIVANAFTLMEISIAGLGQSVRLDSGVAGLAERGYLPIAAFVLLIASIAPLARLLALGAAMTAALRSKSSPWMTTALRWSESMRGWAMLDVFLVGALIAFSKLHGLARVDIGVAMWALAALVVLTVWLESTLDMPALWAAVGPASPPRACAEAADRTRCCEVCRLMQPDGETCLRCRARLHRRKPDVLHRTAALVVTGVILYIPANLYPVFTVVSFGKETTATIMGGVIELMTGDDWPLAVIVFVASIVVPLLKLVGLGVLTVSTRLRWRGYLRARTRLFRLIELVGRWSSVDIFVAAILTALVTLGNLATIVPGLGVLAFGAVVFVTIVATSAFDPRTMWDAAGANDEQ
ncbi:paraquat-inducible protein A [soil metagenome]